MSLNGTSYPKIYHGRMRGDRAVVYVTTETDQKRRYLQHRTGRDSHSPTGFNWGYLGSGPAELAYAIVKDILGRVPSGFLYQEFKAKAIATIPIDRWRWDVREELFRCVLDPIVLQEKALREAPPPN